MSETMEIPRDTGLIGGRRDDAGPVRTAVRRTLRESGYALSAFPVALAAFILVTVLVTTGLSLLITLVGLPILAVAIWVAREFARLERLRIRTMLGHPASTPAYTPVDPEDGWVRRIVVPLRDPQSWLDVVWSVLGIVTGTAAFTVALTWWVAAPAGLTYGLWDRFLPDPSDPVTLASLIGLGDSRAAEVLLQTSLGALAAVTLPFVVRLACLVHGGMARALLCSRAELQQEVARLGGSRDAAREAEAESFRRLERDIHDGPQQGLVRITMDLARARRQLETDPAQVAQTLDIALEQARATVDELRSLTRGIAPPVLVDRGLTAALRELASRSPIPVDLVVELPDSIPAHVETATYFVVSEALTNVAKHSNASAVRLSVVLTEGMLVAQVDDDGVGGALPAKGRGLAGLEQRVHGVDGTLVLTSPEGGPTTVRAEIPCASR